MEQDERHPQQEKIQKPADFMLGDMTPPRNLQHVESSRKREEEMSYGSSDQYDLYPNAVAEYLLVFVNKTYRYTTVISCGVLLQ